MDQTTIVFPGDKIGNLSDYQAGFGTHCHGEKSEIRSSLWGRVKVEKGEKKDIISVVHGSSQDSNGRCNHRRPVVPNVNSLVMARITNTNARLCKAEIFTSDSHPLFQPFHGILRKEDVRATEKDSVDLYKSFRPGDIVHARVIALGDSQAYALSTAENELGVVHTCGEGGVAMVPISWSQMQCPETGRVENRKVAQYQLGVSMQDATQQ